MDNNKLFKALSSQTRIKILKILLFREIHLSNLAKEIDISIPVTSRHVNILLATGLIKKRIVGNVHLLSANMGTFEKILEPFIDESTVEISKNDSLFDALKQLPGIDVQKVGDNQYITSIDGEKGFFIYEVDGVSPKVSIDQYKPQHNIILHLRKLVSVDKKRIEVKIRHQKEKK